MTLYSVRRMMLADLPLVARWLKTPAVREWWIDADGQPSDPMVEEDLHDPHVAMWIVSHHDEPFAFIQDYDPQAWAGHHLGHLPAGSRGIDQFIGEPHMIGIGHGSALVRSHVNSMMARGVPAVGTDPHPANGRAIRAYQKAGFAREAETFSEWGPCLVMTRYASRAE